MQLAYPTPRDDDAEDVAWQLTTGGVVWTAGDVDGAVTWLQRAARSAFDDGLRVRATELSWALQQIQEAIVAARASAAPPAPPQHAPSTAHPAARSSHAPPGPPPARHAPATAQPSVPPPAFDLQAQEPEPMSAPPDGDIDWLAEARAAKAQHPDDLTPPIALPQRTPWRAALHDIPAPVVPALPSSWAAALGGAAPSARAPSPFASTEALPSYADELEPVEPSVAEGMSVGLPTPTPLSIAPGGLIEPEPTAPPAVVAADEDELADDDIEITEFDSVEEAEADEPAALVAVPEPDSLRGDALDLHAMSEPEPEPTPDGASVRIDLEPVPHELAPPPLAVAAPEIDIAALLPDADEPTPRPRAVAEVAPREPPPPSESHVIAAVVPPPEPAPPAPPAAADATETVAPATDPLHEQLLAIEAFADLPDDVRADLVAHATITTLATDDELPTGDLAFIVAGEAAVKLAVADAVAKRVRAGDLVPSRGTHAKALKLDLVATMDGVVVATWTHAILEPVLASCPWIVDDLKAEGDRVQALAGATLGPLGERLDEALRVLALDKMRVRVFEPFETVMETGKPPPGVAVVGVGTVELQAPGEPPYELGPGALIGASEILSGGPAASSARAGASGAVLLVADRHTAHELVVSCPPLLEVFSTS